MTLFGMTGNEKKRRMASIFIPVGVVTFILTPLYPLLSHLSINGFTEILDDEYYRGVIFFTFGQAFAGSALSILVGVPTALALWRLNVRSWQCTATFSDICFVLPSIIAAIFIIRLYGNAGVFSMVPDAIFPGLTGIYGLTGIFAVYLFLNIPFVVMTLLTGLNQMPPEYRLLAENLGLGTGAVVFRILLPYLRPYVLNVGFIIFSICFTAFPTVLMMGGGPQYSIMEVEIYRFVRYEFFLSGAAVLSVIQVVGMVAIGLTMIRFARPVPINTDLSRRAVFFGSPSLREKIIIGISFCVFGLLTLFPLIFGFLSLIGADTLRILTKSYFWDALGTSLLTAVPAAVAGIAVAVGLSLVTRAYKLTDYGYSNMIFIVSPIVFATGIFILFRNVATNPITQYVAVIMINALIVLPFVAGILKEALAGTERKYGFLCRTMRITGLRRLRYVDYPSVKPALLKAFSMAACLSVGEFSVIAIFGTEKFTTLPLLIYRLSGSYQTREADAVAFWLLTVFLLLFFLPKIMIKSDKNA